MNGAQITIMILTALSLLSTAYQHGQEHEGKHNFPYNLMLVVILQGIYYWGGFWDI